MSALAVFSYIGQDVRTVTIDGEPHWIAADIAKVLGLANPRVAVARLDPDDVCLTDVIDSIGRTQQMSAINEAALYELIIRSDKPDAKQFRRWITSVVLPEIRRTGSFAIPETPEQLLSRALVLATETLTAKDEQIQQLAPRADAWDAIASAEGDYSVGDAAKMLARAGIPTGPTRLFAQLLDLKWTYRGSDGKPRAYADRVERGYLAEKPQFHYHPGTGVRVIDAPQVRVTMKGIERLRQRLHIGALQAVTT